jgi:hypothetical protein
MAAALPFGELLELHDAQNDGRLNILKGITDSAAEHGD